MTADQLVCVAVVGRADDTAEEVRPQTDRERQLEQQLSYMIKRLHRHTVQAMKKQKKLENDYHLTMKELKYSRNQDGTERQHTDGLQVAESAEKELISLGQQQQKEEAVLDEYRKTCERILLRELGVNVFSNRSEVVKRQDSAAAKTKTWQKETRLAAERTQNTWISWLFKTDLPEHEVRMARERKEKRDEELTLIDTRQNQWGVDRTMSLKRRAGFRDDVSSSISRQRRIRLILIFDV